MNSFFIRVLSISTLLALWELTGRFFVDPFFLPPPSQIAERLTYLSQTGELWVHIIASLKRVLFGFVIGSTTGVVLGCCIGGNPIIREFVELPINFFRSVNPLALVPLIMLWFGVDELSKIILISYLVTIVVLYNTANGVVNVPENLIRAARCMGLKQAKIFYFVIIPAAAPGILNGLRLGLGFAILVVIGAEMIGASEGIGYFIMLGRQYIAIDDIFVGLVTLGLLGIFLNQLFLFILRIFLQRYVRTNF